MIWLFVIWPGSQRMACQSQASTRRSVTARRTICTGDQRPEDSNLNFQTLIRSRRCSRVHMCTGSRHECRYLVDGRLHQNHTALPQTDNTNLSNCPHNRRGFVLRSSSRRTGWTHWRLRHRGCLRNVHADANRAEVVLEAVVEVSP